MRKTKHGFTLVELLVVIGIMAVLIATLLPALNKARAAARTVVCASNMRQIGLMFTQYAQTYGVYPNKRGYNTHLTSTEGSWQYALKAARLIRAGAKAGQTPFIADWWGEPDVDGKWVMARENVSLFCPDSRWTICYGMSGTDTGIGGSGSWSWPPPSGAHNMRYTRFSKVRRTSETLALMESKKDNPHDSVISNNSTEWGWDLHNKGSNYLFVDGHVEKHPKGWMKMDVGVAGGVGPTGFEYLWRVNK